MRFDRRDAVALLAVPLVIAAFAIASAALATVCLAVAGSAIALAVAGHDEWSWKRRIGICACVFAVDLGALVSLYRVKRADELKQQVAPLVASALPQPVSGNCPIPRNAVALYLGNRISVVAEFPHVIFRVHGEDVFRIDRDSSGLLVSFRVFGETGAPVARLERNTFTAETAGPHVERPDPSNLFVYDDRGTKVLELQFLNPQALQITGVLRYPGVEPLVITEKYTGQGGSILTPVCTAGATPDFDVK